MARVKLKTDGSISGISGKVGDMVFRQRNGKTFVSKASNKTQKERTAKQQANNSNFQRAVIYAKKALADPVAKQMYKAKVGKGKSAYNLALADFLHAPKILKVDLSGYSGKAGEVIRIEVIDDFAVKAVKLGIHRQDGTLEEEGDALQTEDNLDWTYIARITIISLVEIKIVVTATDYSGNLGIHEQSCQK